VVYIFLFLQEKYVFKHPQPKRPQSIRIYEAHVGMSSPVRTLYSLYYIRKYWYCVSSMAKCQGL